MPDPVIDLTHDSDDEPQTAATLPVDLQRALTLAIHTAPEARARKVLLDLVKSRPELRREVYQGLFKPDALLRQDEEEDEDSSGASSDEASSDSGGRKRHLVLQWTMCAACGEQYIAGHRRIEGECAYHPGSLEVNYEAFVDWDPDVHGEEDTPQNRRDYPENFTWSCCGEDGTAEACRTDIHRPSGNKKQRRY